MQVVRTDGINAELAQDANVGPSVATNLLDEVGDGGRVQPVNAAH